MHARGGKGTDAAVPPRGPVTIVCMNKNKNNNILYVYVYVRARARRTRSSGRVAGRGDKTDGKKGTWGGATQLV